MGARWIWYEGEYEVFHNREVHARREQYGTVCPAVWHIPTLYNVVEFNRNFTAEKAFTFTCVAHGEGQVCMDGDILPLDAPVYVAPGEHKLKVRIQNFRGLPCLFIDSEGLVTDEEWTATLHTRSVPASVGCIPAYCSPDEDPERFPFVRTEIYPEDEQVVEGGLLYDFGREVFASVVLECMNPEESYSVYYGECRGEAMEGRGYRHCTVWEEISGKTEAQLTARGFRFVRVVGASPIRVHAITEMLDVKPRGRFSCDRPEVERIYDVCAYTFHLCSREFYFDGIKRDRWVWGGDVRESLMIGDYLFADREVGRRSLLALLPKDFALSHVNNINDYSTLTLIAIWEYYLSFGDVEFVCTHWNRIRLLYDFVLSRLDGDGQMVSRPGDWLFIDWSIMDKSGPLAAEQILLWQAHRCMARLCPLVGEDPALYEKRAEDLRRVILERYWRDDRGCFIDCYTSGKENVSRHGNIFAILFDLVDGDRQNRILKHVLRNDAVRSITTPYFKIYELAALCKLGYLADAQSFMEQYWGGMLALGATSAWEQYDPTQIGDQHYAMYGEPYGKSLCHAWSCGPIYLLGRYCLGVSPTTPAYETFTVAPEHGLYTAFSGTVPTVRGDIRVSVEGNRVTVNSELDGGRLIWGEKQYDIPKNSTLTVVAE
ncbi:MAG: hypothetical protein J6D16_04345 [Clostridia bacterium]|nr:hypothetical protein [Clostridia bacterium]